MEHGERTRILFVCLGNICRSPLAEGVLLHKINHRGVAERFFVDSAGTGGWHTGEPADPRARDVAGRHGVSLPSRARRVHPEDFQGFDLIVCMDQSNLEDLLEIGAPKERLRLMLDFHPDTRLADVPDPYFGAEDGFATVYRLIDAACDGLLDELLAVKQ